MNFFSTSSAVWIVAVGLGTRGGAGARGVAGYLYVEVGTGGGGGGRALCIGVGWRVEGRREVGLSADLVTI